MKIAIISTLCVATFLSIFLTISLVKSNERINSNTARNVELSDSLIIMKNTIIELNDSLKSIKQAKLANQDIITYYYVVRRGDSFCRISFKFFGSEQYAKEIADLNGKDLSELIFPNTRLLIPQK